MLDVQRAVEDERVLVEVGPLAGSTQPDGERMWATLTRLSPVLTRPAYSSISFGLVPAASTRLGPSISCGMAGTLEHAEAQRAALAGRAQRERVAPRAQAPARRRCA